MEIGGLGFVNTVVSSSKDGSQSSAGNNFLGLLGAVMASSNAVEALPATNGIKKEDILGLLELLKAEDILDIEGGLELYKQTLGTEDSEELLSIVINFIMGENKPLQTIVGSSEPLSTDVIPNGVEEQKVDLKDLMKALEEILSLPLKDFNRMLSGEMKDIIKTLRAFELIVQEQNNIKENGQLKDLLQQLTKKMEQLIEQSKGTLTDSPKQAARLDYLQTTFRQAATEIQMNAQKVNSKGEAQVEIKSESMGGSWQLQQMSRAEQLTLTVSTSGKPTSAADLIKQFENILARSQFSNGAGTQKLLIKLNPEHLGALRIELIQRDAGIVAKIMTTTQVAKEALESHLNGLRQAFGSQNIQVDRVEISQAMTQQQERSLEKDSQQQQQQSREKQEADTRSEDSEENSFSFSLEEALVNTKV